MSAPLPTGWDVPRFRVRCFGRLAICAVFPEVPAAQSELGKRVDRHTDHAHGFYCVARELGFGGRKGSRSELQPRCTIKSDCTRRRFHFYSPVPSSTFVQLDFFGLRIIFLEWDETAVVSAAAQTYVRTTAVQVEATANRAEGKR